MDKLTNSQLKEQIARWQLLIAQEGIRLSGGEVVPDKFFHVLLGVGYSTFKKMHSGQDSIRAIQPYTAKTIRYLNKLNAKVFLKEVRRAIIEYENLQSSFPATSAVAKRIS
jgi:hypothetical protein